MWLRSCETTYPLYNIKRGALVFACLREAVLIVEFYHAVGASLFFLPLTLTLGAPPLCGGDALVGGPRVGGGGWVPRSHIRTGAPPPPAPCKEQMCEKVVPRSPPLCPYQMLRSNSLPTESVGKEWCLTFGGGRGEGVAGGGQGHTGGGAKRGSPPPPPRGAK